MPRTGTRFAALLTGITLSFAARAADFRTTSDAANVLYDAPSARAKPLYVYGRNVPIEALVTVEGWTKIRDASGYRSTLLHKDHVNNNCEAVEKALICSTII